MSTLDKDFLALVAEGARGRWEGSAGLRGEFKSADEYTSFVMAVASGNVGAATDGWAREWRATGELQREFPSAEAYVAFRKAYARASR